VRALFAGKIGIDAKNHAAGVETFNSQGFVTVTGDRIGGEALLPCPPAMLEEILTTVRAGRRRGYQSHDATSSRPPPETPEAALDVRLPLTLWKRLEKPYRDGCDRSREAFLIALDLNRAGLSAEQALALMARPDCDVLTPALERRGGDIESARVWLWKYVVAPAYQQGGTHGR
jgi:hypothetical protein